MRRVSGNFVPYDCRQLPGNAEPFARPQNTVRTWPTVSEHRRPSTHSFVYDFPFFTRSRACTLIPLVQLWRKWMKATPVGPHYDVVPERSNISPSTPYLSPHKAHAYGPVPGMFVNRFIRRRVSKTLVGPSDCGKSMERIHYFQTPLAGWFPLLKYSSRVNPQRLGGSDPVLAAVPRLAPTGPSSGACPALTGILANHPQAPREL